MADQKASSTSAPAKKRTRSTGPPPRSVVVPTPDDLEVAKSDALLQLRIGRSAHYYSVVVSAALLFDGFLVLFLQPDLSLIASSRVEALTFLVFPLLSGLVLAAFGLKVKWEAYQLWPWEAHFSLTVASVGFNALLFAVYLLNILHVTAVGHWTLLPWYYPLSLLGVTLPLVALAMTWSEWTQRKTVSVVAAILPLAFAIPIYVLPVESGTLASALAATLFVSAALYQTSGSFLHLISSGTRVHEREVLSSGQGRLFVLAEELRQKQEALAFREQALIHREADAEDTEASLLRQRQALEDARSQFHDLEEDLRSRTTSVAQEQQKWALQTAETNSQKRSLEDQAAELAMREKDVATRLPGLARREQEVLEREGAAARREAELKQRELDADQRLKSAPELEAQLETRRTDLDQRTQELLRRESELASRETMADMGQAERGNAQARLNALTERETQLKTLKLALDEQNAKLGRQAKTLDESTRSVKEREIALAKRLEDAAKKEADVKQREGEAVEKLAIATQRQQQYEQAVKSYEEKMRLVERQQAEITTQSGEVGRIGTNLKARENTLKEREARLEALQASLDQARHDVAVREKTLAQRESDASLKAAALSEGTPSGEGIVRIPPPAPTLPPEEGARAAFLSAPSVPSRLPDRAPTGLPRIDDLLSGGIPPHGHVLLVGPPFIGKEILLYSFIAEGLKRGEPVILVAASRSPEEVAQQVGLVNPQFKEFEQKGRVLWVDASNPSGAASAKSPSNQWSAKGPEDHAGILSALVQASKKLEGSGAKGMRVGFLGLGNCLVHAEPKQAYSFLQNLVGIMKPRPMLALYTVDGGTLSDAQLESVQSRMDGAIEFKQDRSKTFLSVHGLGEVQTRDWVEYRATNRTILIGSFSLERIR